jgi:nicotinamidase-related amidase
MTEIAPDAAMAGEDCTSRAGLPRKGALLVIDFQRAVFLDRPVANRAEEVVANLVRAAGAARSAGRPVIFVRHEEPGSSWERDTQGWRWPDNLAPAQGDAVIDKTSSDAFCGTALQQILDALGVTHIVIGGYATEFCVDTTVRSAASRGFELDVLSDAHTTRDRVHLPAASIIEHHNRTWTYLVYPGSALRVRPTAEVLAAERWT